MWGCEPFSYRRKGLKPFRRSYFQWTEFIKDQEGLEGRRVAYGVGRLELVQE